MSARDSTHTFLRHIGKDPNEAEAYPNGRARPFVFTINNYTEDDVDRIKNYRGLHYACVGREIAPTTGTPHLQGYIRTTNPVSLNRLKETFPNGHFIVSCLDEKALQLAIDYCKKGGDFFEVGNPPDFSGRRKGNGWETLARFILPELIDHAVYLEQQMTRTDSPPIKSLTLSDMNAVNHYVGEYYNLLSKMLNEFLWDDSVDEFLSDTYFRIYLDCRYHSYSTCPTSGHSHALAIVIDEQSDSDVESYKCVDDDTNMD